MNSSTRNKIFLAVILVLISAWRITSGEWEIPLSEVVYFLRPEISESEKILPEAIVIRSVRLPRLLCSMGTGGLLSVSGTVLQGVLANPLAEPYTLGIASGAAFGAAIGILYGSFMAMTGAFAGALGALILTMLIAYRGGSSKIILAGVISNAILSSGVTFLKAIAGDKLSAVVLWLMGSFSGAGTNNIYHVLVGVIIIIIPAYIFAPVLDVMSLGKDYANILGFNENHVRIFLLAAASLSTAFSVSSFGVIGFVGLVVPHISRALTGASHRKLIVHAFFTGACLLCIADGVAQMLGELPAGVITALTGGPFFCWLLSKK